jgi:hypothetical protein
MGWSETTDTNVSQHSSVGKHSVHIAFKGLAAKEAAESRRALYKPHFRLYCQVASAIHQFRCPTNGHVSKLQVRSGKLCIFARVPPMTRRSDLELESRIAHVLVALAWRVFLDTRPLAGRPYLPLLVFLVLRL